MTVDPRGVIPPPSPLPLPPESGLSGRKRRGGLGPLVPMVTPITVPISHSHTLTHHTLSVETVTTTDDPDGKNKGFYLIISYILDVLFIIN